MALTLYKKRRSFEQTSEPIGGKATGKELRFVIQKHAASRLHYDFRLEMQGVLKSWAVPKGPSLNPADKRLAMMVEDHPYDYRNFEGIIPKGNYGAGTVIVWDEGTYKPINPKGDLRAQEKDLLKQLKAGSIKISMKGKKLKGEFAFVKLKGKEDNAWLLIKHRDKFAKETDITKKDKSVVSGKTLEKVAASSTLVYSQQSGTPVKITKAKTKKVFATKRPTLDRKAGAAALIPGKKAAFPKDLSPMLATLVTNLLTNPAGNMKLSGTVTGQWHL